MARYVQSKTADGSEWGAVEGDHVVPLSAAPWAGGVHRANITPKPLSSLTLLPPTGMRATIACAARNYRAHAAELQNAVPDYPLIFIKPSSALIPEGGAIELPRPESNNVQHEGELAIVIGRQAKNISLEKAHDVIFGYTIFNDVTARDIQRKEGKFTRAKGYDTFAPIGPWIDTEFTPNTQAISVTVNGELRQHGLLDEMIFSIPELIVAVSGFMTLHPGDIIATGTPSGVASLTAGDVVTVTIEGLGSLTNPVIERPRHA